MFLEDLKKIKSGKEELKSFGWLLGVIFGLIALLLVWRQKEGVVIFSAVSLFFLFFGTFAPAVLKPLQQAWMALALAIGWVMTRVILSILFFGVLTPISFLGRLMRKKFLNTSFRDSEESYWMDRDSGIPKKEHYEVQY